MKNEVIRHYDMLIDEENDPFRDPPPLKEYMDKWDGQLFIEVLGLSGEEDVLEIGIGTGRIAEKVAPLCNNLYGIDISPKTISRARENLCGIENIQLVCSDFMEYGFEQNYDVIYSSLTLMHFEDKQAVVSRIADLLKVGGKCVLSLDKNKAEYIDMGERKIKVYPDTPTFIANCAKKVGLKLIDIIETEFANIVVLVK